MLRTVSTNLILTVFITLLFALAVSSITIGPMRISWMDSLAALTGETHSNAPHIGMIIHQIRLPRTLLCMLVGAILAICGAVMQGLFRNPLAEPGIIGVSAGASLGAAIAIVIFSQLDFNAPSLLSLFTLPLFAFLGGTVTTLLVYRLGTGRMGTSVTVMLLAGVAISAISGAGIGYLNFIASDQMLRDLSLWSMGSLAGANYSHIGLCAAVLSALMIIFLRKAMALNALLLGESEAKHLGIAIQSLKRQLILLTALGVGVTVSVAGSIGFIGLVVPHLGRMLCGPDHRRLIPISAILGAVLMTAADIFARVAVAPAELPVGIVTALIGAPFFIYLLFKQRGHMR